VGIDAYRYFLLREVPFGLDGNFSETALQSRYQADLANNLGNLLNRTLTMLEKYFDGIIPEKSTGKQVDKFEKPVGALLSDVEKKLADAAFSQALESVWAIIDLANKYIEEEAPWKLAKTDRDRLAVVLYTLTDVLRLVAAYLYPFMPGSATKIWEQLGLSESLSAINLKDISLGQIPAGTKVQKGVPLFPKLL
jgi:methionyl-tRNA synthetase